MSFQFIQVCEILMYITSICSLVCFNAQVRPDSKPCFLIIFRPGSHGDHASSMVIIVLYKEVFHTRSSRQMVSHQFHTLGHSVLQLHTCFFLSYTPNVCLPAISVFLRGGKIRKWGISMIPDVMTLKSNFYCSCYAVYEVVGCGKIDTGNKSRY